MRPRRWPHAAGLDESEQWPRRGAGTCRLLLSTDAGASYATHVRSGRIATVLLDFRRSRILREAGATLNTA
jgi:hypothetical protein